MFTRTASIVTIICIVTATTIPSFKPTAADESNYPGPVIFVPGDGGSQLEARLHKPDHVHYWCWLNSDWFDIWLNIRLLTPAEFDCFSDNMRLFYNATTRTTQNDQGVEIRSTNYGSLDSVTYLNTAKIYQTDYFENIAAALEKVHKLKRNDDMVGAPYDFRKAPNELEEFFQNLTRQIEHQYVIHNSEPVTLICHSMGCLNTLYLLNRQSQNWKDVLIRRVIALAAPWHGSFKAIKTMLFGDDLGIPVIFKYRQGVLQDLQKTFPSLMYLFPRAPSFDGNQTIVQTPAANYTLKNLDKLFEAANLLDQREMWHDVRSIADNLKAPNVELWCLYGNIPNSTPARLKIDKPFDDFKFEEILGAGDGTVNLDSLKACEYFAQQQSKPVYTREFENFDHVDVLKKKEVADFITSQIFNSSMAWNRIK